MIKRKVHKPKCIDCEFRIVSCEDHKSTVLQLGKHYCSYGNKYREFKKIDPKVYPPSWCPKLKSPSEFRIYDFKDSEAWLLYQMSKTSSAPPSYRCAVRLSGTIWLSPVEFFRRALESDVSILLGVAVQSGEIIEIDDGLKPYCFYYSHRSVDVLTHWDPEKAQRNFYHSEPSIRSNIEE